MNDKGVRWLAYWDAQREGEETYSSPFFITKEYICGGVREIGQSLYEERECRFEINTVCGQNYVRVGDALWDWASPRRTQITITEEVIGRKRTANQFSSATTTDPDKLFNSTFFCIVSSSGLYDSHLRKRGMVRTG